jgi:hypothetical protein
VIKEEKEENTETERSKNLSMSMISLSSMRLNSELTSPVSGTFNSRV